MTALLAFLIAPAVFLVFAAFANLIRLLEYLEPPPYEPGREEIERHMQ